jgi:hypothetical protein
VIPIGQHVTTGQWKTPGGCFSRSVRLVRFLPFTGQRPRIETHGPIHSSYSAIATNVIRIPRVAVAIVTFSQRQ